MRPSNVTTAYTKHLDAVAKCAVGTKLWTADRKRPYRVRARSGNFLVCTKPHNPRHTVIYFIIDLKKQIRGTENLVFPHGAETDEDCQAMINRLVAGETEVSHRNWVPLDIVRIEEPC